MRQLRPAVLVLTLALLRASTSSAQSLVFTSAVPASISSGAVPGAVAVVEERGLALWSGAESDFGAGVSASVRGWTVRSTTSLTSKPIDGHDRPAFQQVDVMRPLFGRGSLAVAAGGGLREEWGGTRTYVGRVIAGAALRGGRIEGSVVVERTTSPVVGLQSSVGSQQSSGFNQPSVVHDAADVITTVGWSRAVGGRFALGVEGIGQDLEGLWNPAEADGGAKLLVGPSIHARSASGAWTASLTGGPVIRTLSTVAPPILPATPGHHFGIFASATWAPAAGR